MTGLWVIGHECGHGGFSDSTLVNDVVGWLVHSSLLVPYFSWKISHRRHHSNTGNIAKDEVFVPSTKPVDAYELEDDSVFATLNGVALRLFHMFITFTIGWPLYLFINATGHEYPKGKWVNHFLPSSPIYTTDKERFQVILSDIGLVLFIGLLSVMGTQYGFLWLFKVYGIPYLIVNFFLVLITFLQHTDPVLPHYTDSEWDWLRGALATVDRDFGILNHVFHHIADTHVVHHLFHEMPHYNAQKATEAVKKVLGDYHRSDNTRIALSLWRNFACESVQPDPNNKSGVLWFRKPINVIQLQKQQ